MGTTVGFPVDAYLWVMDRDRGRVLERQAARITVKRYRYDLCMGVVEVTEGQFTAARREPYSLVGPEHLL